MITTKFTAFEPITGEVLFSGTATDPDIMNTPDISIYIGEAFTNGWIINNIHYDLPSQPTPNSTFNYVTKVWEDTRLLADVKDAQKMVINLSRAKANQTSFIYETKEIAVDALSRSDIEGTNGYVLANNSFPAGWPGGWKCMDNTYVPITAIATWNLFYAAMVNQGTANFAKAQTLKAAIDAATTIAEVEAIVW